MSKGDDMNAERAAATQAVADQFIDWWLERDEDNFEPSDMRDGVLRHLSAAYDAGRRAGLEEAAQYARDCKAVGTAGSDGSKTGMEGGLVEWVPCRLTQGEYTQRKRVLELERQVADLTVKLAVTEMSLNWYREDFEQAQAAMGGHERSMLAGVLNLTQRLEEAERKNF